MICINLEKHSFLKDSKLMIKYLLHSYYVPSADSYMSLKSLKINT